MANENSRDPTIPKPQSIPLAKIHDLPGIPLVRQPDKSYGGLVTSIQSGGAKEPVILRLREDGEYQLVTGYRRKRACELMKKQEIPALVYEMSLQEAIRYHGLANGKPTPPVPGKLVEPGSEGKKAETPDIKEPRKPTTGEKPKEARPPEAPKAPEPPTGEKKEAPAPKKEDKPAAPAPGERPKEAKPPEGPKGPEPPTGEKKEAPAPKKEDKPAAPVPGEKPKEAPVTGPAAKGPAGTAISQVLDERLTPPDEKAKRDVPSPEESEAFFILLHPAYLEKSKYNTISVDTRSEDYLELKKSIELNGVKDPVLARIGDEGTLEILSGQRRHLIATELNYPVPTIIQKISDADAKILVADGNLHRPHISMYDLSRSLRMKMEGMKQKAGRKKKGTFKAEELDSDEKLAQEMGMKVSKGIQILAPCHFTCLVEYEKKDPATGRTLYGPNGKPLTEKRQENATRFRIATVFDVSQTEGRELPSLVSDLSGDVPDFENVYARLAALCPLPVELGPVPGTAKGYASFAENRVVVRSGMSQAQTIKTLIHETAHAKLHPPDFLSEFPKPRREKEVEAESVAYVVCQHFGIDTSDYSMGYVAGWSRGKELAELKASLDVIHSTAGEIINAIQPPPPELTRDEPSQEHRRKTSYRKFKKRK